MAEGSALIAALRAASPSAEAAPQAQSFQTLSFPWQRNAPATPSPVMQSPMPAPVQAYTPPPRSTANVVPAYTTAINFPGYNQFTPPIDYMNPTIRQPSDQGTGYNMPDYTNQSVYYAQYNDADPALWNLSPPYDPNIGVQSSAYQPEPVYYQPPEPAYTPTPEPVYEQPYYYNPLAYYSQMNDSDPAMWNMY